MSFKVLNINNNLTFGDLRDGEIFIESNCDHKPYEKTFLIKLPTTKNESGVECNAREFNDYDQSSRGRLVRLSDGEKVFRAKFTNVELTLL